MPRRAIIAVLITLAGAAFLGSRVFPQTRTITRTVTVAARATVTVPEVVGLSWPKAAARVDGAGLCVRFARVVPGGKSGIGTVVAERPAAGAGAKRLDTVSLDVRFRTPKPRGKGGLVFISVPPNRNPGCPPVIPAPFLAP